MIRQFLYKKVVYSVRTLVDEKYSDLVEKLKVISEKSNKIVFLLDRGLKYNVLFSTFAKEIRSGSLSEKFDKIEIRLNNDTKDSSLYDDVSKKDVIYPVSKFSSPGISVNENYQNRIYKTPTTINLEITEGCNFRCNHCYNPWREVSQGINSLSKDQCDYLIDQFIKCGIFTLFLAEENPFQILRHSIHAFKAYWK